MLLSDLLDRRVTDAEGRALGFVVDVRLVLDGPLDGLLAAPRLHGVLVSPRTGSSFLGYERTGESAPALVAWWLRRRHRGTFLVLWPDVEEVDDVLRLRADHTRWSAALPQR
ncbi:PRC-barrel domain-containing protein [Cellulomonas gilvus]|uniref:PRC-barrel domain-containing protein n=1 Tax=Cellulomonas gilvus (strain ATCC 13127 / NRRL B-14078) TaxID=593907 RepID=F8A0H8_CELGA|nr:hypothetical protein [Cellulomonas gilvus]AEI11522.1 hypothetical protein Celgi_1003 [Cellulomonas gilvus ATCC 13127]